ncbi:MAG: phasin family protein [Hyphomicrobiaceae bacterium]
MLKSPNAGSLAAEGAPFPPFNSALQACEPFVAGMAEFNGKASKGWAEINRHWVSFLAQRLQEDVALVHNLAKCPGPQDVYSVYSDFFQKAFADYQREFAEMMKLGQASFAEATSRAQNTIETATRETMRSAA